MKHPFFFAKKIKNQIFLSIENRRIENSVLETAEYKTARRRNFEVAKELLLLKPLPISMIAQVSKLSEEEVTLLSEGKALDMDTDNED